MVVMKSNVVKRVEDALAEDDRTAEFDINVVGKQGVVTLTGSVDALETKDAATEIAEQQESVLEVINDVEVTGSDLAEDVVPPPPDVRGGTTRSI